MTAQKMARGATRVRMRGRQFIGGPPPATAIRSGGAPLSATSRRRSSSFLRPLPRRRSEPLRSLSLSRAGARARSRTSPGPRSRCRPSRRGAIPWCSGCGSGGRRARAPPAGAAASTSSITVSSQPAPAEPEPGAGAAAHRLDAQEVVALHEVVGEGGPGGEVAEDLEDLLAGSVDRDFRGNWAHCARVYARSA